jgi:hypothetical protein
MVTPFCLFKWLRLPFGMNSAPSCFQKIIAHILEGVPGVRNLLDDIIVSGSSKAQHDERLAQVLTRLKQYNVTINREKSTFGADAVDFVGHHISARGVSPLHSNVEAITNLEPPSKLKELRSFLGAAGYYRKFIPAYSDLVEPLQSLLKDGVPFEWTSQHQQSFEQLKAELVSARVLAHFDSRLDTTVTTDASEDAIGAVLSQTAGRFGASGGLRFAYSVNG